MASLRPNLCSLIIKWRYASYRKIVGIAKNSMVNPNRHLFSEGSGLEIVKVTIVAVNPTIKPTQDATPLIAVGMYEVSRDICMPHPIKIGMRIEKNIQRQS